MPISSHKFQVGRPTQEVRLRNWKPGQAAQFKKAIEILEGELNTAMAAQVAQGAKRVFAPRIPTVTGLVVAVDFKSFQISFNPAKGINNLLFYEIQKDSSSSFPNPTTYTTPQTTLTIPTGSERETIFVRVRIMDSKFQVGNWSGVISATGSSNFRINSIRGTRTELEIATEDFNTWVDVMSVSFNPTVSAVSVSVQPGVAARMSFETTSKTPHRFRFNNYTVYFRLLRNGGVYTNAGSTGAFVQSTYNNRAGEAENLESKYQEAKFTTIVSPLETFTSNATVTYTVQAFVSSDTTDIPVSATGTFTEDHLLFIYSEVQDPALVIVDNFDILEIIQVS
jgi:hypothetical protein